MLSKLPLFTLRNATPLVSTLRHAGHWNKHWQAGPYPKTEEERLAAARKYNLLPEEYQPYEDDGGDAYGDYPKLPCISISNKDRWEAWTTPEDRRDYGEPVHIFEFMLSEDRIEWPYTDPGIWQVPFWKQWLWLISALIGIPSIMYLSDYLGLVHYQPVLARHMPYTGKVHYSYPKKE